jgi:hypothetical protein
MVFFLARDSHLQIQFHVRALGRKRDNLFAGLRFERLHCPHCGDKKFYTASSRPD